MVGTITQQSARLVRSIAAHLTDIHGPLSAHLRGATILTEVLIMTEIRA